MALAKKIFTAFGIPVKLHISMLIIPLFVLNSKITSESLLFGIAIMVLLFGSILLHELGHALTGRLFGVVTKDIILTPIGGIARMTHIPQNPSQEVKIAAAGPMVSFVLAIFSYIVLSLTREVSGLTMIASLALLLLQLNLMLGIFNLIPAFPLDGGRILRGLLAKKRTHLSATRIAARVGRAFALAGIFFALFGGIASMLEGGSFSNWSLLLISIFVYSTSGQEVRMAAMLEAYKRSPYYQEDLKDPVSQGSYVRYYGSRSYDSSKNSSNDEWTYETPQKRGVKIISSDRVKVLNKEKNNKDI